MDRRNETFWRQSQQPLFVVISGPGGAGKDSVIKNLLAQNARFGRPISTTTRPPRDYERNGRDYFFVSPEEFALWESRGEFLETDSVHGHRYGTLKNHVQELAQRCEAVVLNLSYEGLRHMQAEYGEERVVGIYIMPPTREVLAERMSLRGDSDESVAARLEEFDKICAEKVPLKYDCILVNGNLSDTVLEAEGFIRHEIERRKRQ